MSASKACILVLLAAGFFATGVAAQEAKDMHLEDVGFVMRGATTPQQIERLRLLPQRKFVARTVNGRRYYLFADAELCQCVFLGNETAMQSYRDLVSAAPPPPISGGPGGISMSQTVEDIDPAVDASITGGDILDYYPY
jgi:hypothetical protein